MGNNATHDQKQVNGQPAPNKQAQDKNNSDSAESNRSGNKTARQNAQGGGQSADRGGNQGSAKH